MMARTTVNLDDDVARAVEELRRELGVSASAAVNTLARRGLAAPGSPGRPFVQTTSSLGQAWIPVDDIGAALELLEGEARRG